MVLMFHIVVNSLIFSSFLFHCILISYFRGTPRGAEARAACGILGALRGLSAGAMLAALCSRQPLHLLELGLCYC